MKLKYLIVILILFLATPLLGFAHPGGTDSSGCHTCRTNCPNWGLSYGEYHCHRAKALPQPEEPIKSHYGEGGSGYTEPAPEYKAPAPVPTPVPTPAPIPQTKVSPLKSSSQEQPQKVENLEVKSAPQQASINEVIKEKPKQNLWQRILRWFGVK